MRDFTTQSVRSLAILTGSYVAGTVLENVSRQNQLVLECDFTIGSLTNCEIKVEFSQQLFYDLAYDGQTANFTAGKTLTGSSTKDVGIIVKDSDSGATGTLTLRDVKPYGNGTNVLGAFEDNETITDSNSTPGTAVVNGTLSLSTHGWTQETVRDIAVGVVTENLAVHRLTASGNYNIPIPIKCNNIKISAIGNGTATNSLLEIRAVLGTV